MKESEFCAQVFEIARPWRVIRVETDAAAGRVDLWVRAPSARNPFRRSGNRTDNAPGTSIWRHLNFGSYRSYIHASPGDQPFLGDPGVPFTHAMTRTLTGLFREGMNYRRICNLMDVELEQLWILRRCADGGHSTPASTGRPAQHPAPGIDDAVAHGEMAIPDESAPVWEKIISGDFDAHIQTLSLRLLVQRIRSQLRATDDPEHWRSKLGELRQYFDKHSHIYTAEIRQLFMEARMAELD